jgi:diacylglycerol kinase (ATP)
MKRSVWFVINPIAGGKDKKKIKRKILEYWKGDKEQLRFFYTTHNGHGSEIATQAKLENVAVVVAVGGDGTVHEIGTALTGSSCALAIIPCGSGNGFANHFKIPSQLRLAVEKIYHGRTVLVDVGKAGNRLFLSNCGFGIDAFVAKSFSHSKKRGLLNYARLTFAAYFNYEPIKIEWQSHEGTEKLDNVLLFSLANTNEMGNGFQLAPNADASDGRLDRLVIRKKGVFTFVRLLVGARFKLLQSRKNLKLSLCDTGIIKTSTNYMQLDGEFIELSNPEVHLTVLPKSLKLVV